MSVFLPIDEARDRLGSRALSGQDVIRNGREDAVAEVEGERLTDRSGGDDEDRRAGGVVAERFIRTLIQQF